MTEQSITCPSCHTDFTLHRHKKTRWMAAGAGTIIGTAATDSLIGGAIIGAFAYGVTAAIDEYRAHRCPECYSVSFPSRAASEEPGLTPEAPGAPTHH